MPKVCLDPGHSGTKTNTGGWGYYESARMWDLYLLLRAALEARGFEVISTRQVITDHPEIYARGAMSKGCDCFVSLHSNACGTASVDRPVVYRAHDNWNGADTIALKIATSMAKLMGTAQNGNTATRKNSSGTEYYGNMRGARAVQTPLYLLIEHSFHTNEKASKWLLDDNNLKALAELEADILAEHYGLSANTTGATVAPSLPIDTPVSSVGEYTITTTVDNLNIRQGAGTGFAVVGAIKESAVKNAYTIVEENNGWGKLKSGVGWICLAYTKQR